MVIIDWEYLEGTILLENTKYIYFSYRTISIIKKQRAATLWKYSKS